MRQLTRQQLVKKCIDFYSSSRDANGLPVGYFIVQGATLEQIKALVIEAVKQDEIEVVFSETDENPHIRRIPKQLKKPFKDLINHCNLSSACIYPSERIISEKINLEKYKNAPYTLRFWQGKAQLEYIFFDLKILMPYHSDPRYDLQLRSLGGGLYGHDGKLPEDEKVNIDSMAVSYSESGERVLGAMLRYLSNLSSKHQRIWFEQERKDKCRVNEISFEASYFGKWPSAMSVYDALIEEINIISQICVKAFKKTMFKNDFSDSNSKPDYYHVLLISTEREYRNFARALDLIMSENIDIRFFDLFPRIVKQIEDEKLGSIGALKLWIKTYYKPKEGEIDLAVSEVANGFDLVRKERSISAHGEKDNVFDIVYTTKQKELIIEAYQSVRSLRLLLKNLPQSELINIPEWLDEKIVNP